VLDHNVEIQFIIKISKMKKSIIRIIGLFIFYLSGFVMNAQNIDNVIAKIQNNDIVLTYDIKDDQAGKKFNIELWYNMNDTEYKKCQTINCSDGTNIDVTAGNNKKITWMVLKDLSSLECNTLDFEIRAVVNLPQTGGRRR